MNTTTIKIISIIVGTALLAGCNSGPKGPGKYAETAKCLTEKGVVLYGAFWCGHCASQKEMFGEDVQFLTYQECDDKGPDGNRKACIDAGVSSYPTWHFPGQGNLVGAQPIFVIAKLANCQDTLPEEDKILLEESEITTESVTSESEEINSEEIDKSNTN